MQISIEQINLNADRSFKAYKYDFSSQKQRFHAHEEFELAAVGGKGGLLYCGADTSLFSPGDIFLFGRHLPHRFTSLPGMEAAGVSDVTAEVIQFRYDAFGEGFFGLPENHLIRSLLESASGGLVFSSETMETSGRLSVVIRADISRRLPELLLLLSDLAAAAGSEKVRVLSPGSNLFGNRGNDGERLHRLQEFIETEYAGKISLDDAAGVLALTRTSFCRYIKRITGRTFTELVNDYRLTIAAMMLRNSAAASPSVAVLSEEVGFGSLSHFNSRFKARFGMTPKEYRIRRAAGKVN